MIVNSWTGVKPTFTPVHCLLPVQVHGWNGLILTFLIPGSAHNKPSFFFLYEFNAVYSTFISWRVCTCSKFITGKHLCHISKLVHCTPNFFFIKWILYKVCGSLQRNYNKANTKKGALKREDFFHVCFLDLAVKKAVF